jgi:hypothetical protein
LEMFGLASLRDLPDLERLKAERLMQTRQGDPVLDSMLGLDVPEEDGDGFPGHTELGERQTI